MDPEIEQLAHHYAAQHGLPDWLVVAIILQESAGNPWAMRFEPRFLERYVPVAPERYGAVSVPTERIALATSWGAMQIMGLTARTRGFHEPFLSALCYPETGIEYGCRQLEHLKVRYFTTSWEPVIAAYNSGSPRKEENGAWVNAAYVSNVLKHGGITPGEVA